jgi:Tol biopolymer transport system component
MTRALTAALALLMIAAAGSRPASAASLFDPLYRFRRLPTEHFIIYFHQGEDRMAARLGAIAEDAWHKLERPMGTKPPPLTHVVLVDQTDLSNGYTYVLPRDTVVINAVWPSGSEFIGETDDWLTLVFTHEFTHVVHLDRSEGWARIVRNIFGRVPYAFPNLFLPGWQIEGLATYEETAITGEGRLHAGDFAAIVNEAARMRKLEPIDRVNGGLTDWPGGTAQYAYGVGFHAYLAKRFGDRKFAELAAATARRIPYTAPLVFKKVFGKSLGDLWKDYETETIAANPPGRDVDHARRLTHHGFSVSAPRFLPAACATCPPEVTYSVATPDGFPSLYQVALDGSAPRRVARRYLGSTTAPGRDTIYFDQLEVARNTGLYSDLYALDRGTRKVRRITSGARLKDPDLSPDGQTIVATQNYPGHRDLVLVHLAGSTPGASAEIVPLVSDPDTQFDAPRWSPDGRAIAVQRHRLRGQTEIVVVDVATRAVRLVAADPNTRWVTPAWRPDSRSIVAAADLNEGPFNLYEIPLDGPRSRRQLTHTTGGATWPDVSPDGRSVVYVGYTTDGFDLFTVPYGNEPPRPTDSFSEAAPPSGAEAELARPTSYSPLPTLKPTWWSPVIEGDRNSVRVGAATGGADVLGYHGYSASATWLVTSPANAPAVDSATPNWQLSYVYDRWVPTLWASASRDTSFFAGPPSDAGVPSTGTLREQQIQAGVVFPIRRVATTQAFVASVVRAQDDFTFADRAISRNRTAARAGWSAANAIAYGYSISPERGVAFGATTELVPTALGSSAGANAVAADARLYLPGLAAHHVLAVRLAGGSSNGDRDLQRVFDLGGGQGNLDTLDFGREAISLLRGFPADTFAGTRVALMNADYRWPIARPQRGVGPWPFFVHTIHAAVFADAGHAWTRTFSARDLKTSAGAELSIDIVAGYTLPFTASAGAAWGHDGSHTVGDRATVYFRLGHAF